MLLFITSNTAKSATRLNLLMNSTQTFWTRIESSKIVTLTAMRKKKRRILRRRKGLNFRRKLVSLIKMNSMNRWNKLIIMPHCSKKGEIN